MLLSLRIMFLDVILENDYYYVSRCVQLLGKTYHDIPEELQALKWKKVNLISKSKVLLRQN